MPLLKQYVEAGVYVLMGVDSIEWDLPKTKETLKSKVCLWGGVNGQHTVEQGKTEAVHSEVQTALNLLASEGGFILSPVDNVREFTPVSKRIIEALINERQCWKK